MLAVVLGLGVLGLPDPAAVSGASARLSTTIAVHERHASSAVASITFDLRGFDTLIEEHILLVAAVGLAVLLRALRGEGDADAAARRARAHREGATRSLRVMSGALVAPVVLLAGYVISHGHLTPGGGFQGGVVLAGALLTGYVGGRRLRGAHVSPTTGAELADAVGAGAFTLVALGGLVATGAALANVIALGVTGDFLSAGTVPVLEAAVGVEVAGGIVLILDELLDQVLLRGGR